MNDDWLNDELIPLEDDDNPIEIDDTFFNGLIRKMSDSIFGDWVKSLNNNIMGEGTVPSDSDPRLTVYEEYLNNKKG